MRRPSSPVVAITGSGAGIGQGCALAFARAGYRVVINDIDPAGGRDTGKRIRAARGKSVFIHADISTDRGARTLVEGAVAAFGRLDALVNNAGVDISGAVDRIAESDWDKVFSVDVKGIFLCSRHAIPVMKRQKAGVIVNIASVHSRATVPGRAAYAGAKSAVIGITQAMGLELAKTGIRVVALCPGFTQTEILERYLRMARDPEKLRARWLALQPMGRFAGAEEIGGIAVFLASKAAGIMTACSVIADGGLTARLYQD